MRMIVAPELAGDDIKIGVEYSKRTGSEQKVKKMAKNIYRKQTRSRNDVATIKPSALDANELKSVVRDRLVAMNMTEREEFIRTLETEMRRAGLNMRSYLVPLGIPGHTPEELTPTEIAHLIRFLKLTAPRAMPAVERALGESGILESNEGGGRHKIAA